MTAPAETQQRVNDEPRWGMGDALGGWVFAQVLAAVVGGAILLAAGYGNSGRSVSQASMALFALLQTPLWIGFLAAPIWAARTKGRGVVTDFGLRFRPSDLVGVPIGILAQLVMVPVVSYPFLRLSGKSAHDLAEPARQLAERARDGSTVGVIAFVIVAVVGAPIVEELFFRGLVMRSIEKRFGTAVGLVGSALLFGITHFELLQLPALSVAGLIFGALALRSGRLGPAVACHLAFNATTVVAMLWFS